MLCLNNVSKSYGETCVLAPLSLTIESGKCVTLIGPSGCGKSTLIRLMIGLIQPDNGTVMFRDQQVSMGRDTPKDQLNELRHQMGYVVQGGGLFPHLNAKDNVTLIATNLGWESARIEKRVAELADLVHLPADLMVNFPAQLSGGQQQRVSLMRALMLDPELLLMDEPLGALDPLIRADLQRDLRDIIRTLEKTAVIVTHDMGEAAYFGDEIVMLQKGRIVQQGTIEEFIHQPADSFVTEFLSAQRSYLDEVAAT